MCYHDKFSSSATKGVRISIKEPQNWGALRHRPFAVGAWLTPWKYATPHVRYPAEFGHSMSNGTRIIKEIRLKI